MAAPSDSCFLLNLTRDEFTVVLSFFFLLVIKPAPHILALPSVFLFKGSVSL